MSIRKKMTEGFSLVLSLALSKVLVLSLSFLTQSKLMDQKKELKQNKTTHIENKTRWFSSSLATLQVI